MFSCSYLCILPLFFLSALLVADKNVSVRLFIYSLSAASLSRVDALSLSRVYLKYFRFERMKKNENHDQQIRSQV